MKHILVPFTVIFALFPALVMGQPAVANVTGDVSEGSSISIVGTGFGSNSGAKSVLDIPNTQTYGNLADGSTIPTGSGWPFLSNTHLRSGAVKFSRQHRRHPGAEAAFRVTGGAGYLHNPVALGGGNPSSAYTQLYVSYWFKPDSSVDVGNHSSKFLRIWDDNGGDGTRVSWTQMHLTYDPDKVSWGGWGGKTGEWNRLEFFIDSQAGQIRAWTNGKLVHSANDFTKAPKYPNIGLHLERVGFDPGGASPPMIDSSFSDIYASNTQARVELCNSPTWAACTVRELQPVASWGNEKIDIKFTLGSLTSSLQNNSLYIYVVDSVGRVNANGALLCAACTSSPPQAPTSVNVDE